MGTACQPRLAKALQGGMVQDLLKPPFPAMQAAKKSTIEFKVVG